MYVDIHQFKNLLNYENVNIYLYQNEYERLYIKEYAIENMYLLSSYINDIYFEKNQLI